MESSIESSHVGRILEEAVSLGRSYLMFLQIARVALTVHFPFPMITSNLMSLVTAVYLGKWSISIHLSSLNIAFFFNYRGVRVKLLATHSRLAVFTSRRNSWIPIGLAVPPKPKPKSSQEEKRKNDNAYSYACLRSGR